MPAGSIVSRATNDTEAIKDMFVSVLISVVQAAFLIIGVYVAMFFLNVKLALLMLFLLPVIIYIVWLYRKISSVDVRKCKAAFSADADTETVSLDFEYDGTNVAISNEYVYFFEYDEAFGEASMKNKSGKYWYGDISYGDYGIVVRMADENTLVVYLFSLLSDEGYEIIFIR